MVGMLSDVGCVRKLNEDYVGYYEDEKKGIFVIADGMGGHNAGEVASSIAVETTISYIKGLEQIENDEKAILTAVNTANEKIYNNSKEDQNLSGMGTTITACLIVDKHMVVANVGDSSCYVIKKNEIIKITKDHSLVQQLIDSGAITEAEAITHPNKNIITRALGTNDSVMVDLFNIDLKDVVKVVLCTDGLSNVVSKEEIMDTVMQNNNEEACRLLIELSKFKGGRDNISVIIFEGECEYDRIYSK